MSEVNELVLNLKGEIVSKQGEMIKDESKTVRVIMDLLDKCQYFTQGKETKIRGMTVKMVSSQMKISMNESEQIVVSVSAL